MTNAATLLNAIAAELNTNDKTLCINVALAMMVKSGVAISAAMDTLFGEGSYKAMAGQVYDQLRARQGL